MKGMSQHNGSTRAVFFSGAVRLPVACVDLRAIDVRLSRSAAQCGVGKRSPEIATGILKKVNRKNPRVDLILAFDRPMWGRA